MSKATKLLKHRLFLLHIFILELWYNSHVIMIIIWLLLGLGAESVCLSSLLTVPHKQKV